MVKRVRIGVTFLILTATRETISVIGTLMSRAAMGTRTVTIGENIVIINLTMEVTGGVMTETDIAEMMMMMTEGQDVGITHAVAGQETETRGEARDTEVVVEIQEIMDQAAEDMMDQDVVVMVETDVDTADETAEGAGALLQVVEEAHTHMHQLCSGSVRLKPSYG